MSFYLVTQSPGDHSTLEDVPSTYAYDIDEGLSLDFPIFNDVSANVLSRYDLPLYDASAHEPVASSVNFHTSHLQSRPTGSFLETVLNPDIAKPRTLPQASLLLDNTHELILSTQAHIDDDLAEVRHTGHDFGLSHFATGSFDYDFGTMGSVAAGSSTFEIYQVANEYTTQNTVSDEAPAPETFEMDLDLSTAWTNLEVDFSIPLAELLPLEQTTGQASAKNITPSPSPVAFYPCLNCNQYFRSLGEYNHHMLNHSRPHRCVIGACSRAFATVTHLERHAKSTHSALGRLCCSVKGCPRARGGTGKPFSRKDNLTTHIKNVHGEEYLPQGHLVARRIARNARLNRRLSAAAQAEDDEDVLM